VKGKKWACMRSTHTHTHAQAGTHLKDRLGGLSSGVNDTQDLLALVLCDGRIDQKLACMHAARWCGRGGCRHVCRRGLDLSHAQSLALVGRRVEGRNP
jgi:hypothetical protein